MLEGSEFIDWKSASVSVIPAHTGIQAFFVFGPRANLDAGVRRRIAHHLGLRIGAESVKKGGRPIHLGLIVGWIADFERDLEAITILRCGDVLGSEAHGVNVVL